MGAKATTIFNCERGQDVRASVDGNNGLARGHHVNVEFTDLRLLSNITRYRSHIWEGNVTVNNSNHYINNQVPTLGKEVQDDHVS
jgi:hypothetical protein